MGEQQDSFPPILLQLRWGTDSPEVSTQSSFFFWSRFHPIPRRGDTVFSLLLQPDLCQSGGKRCIPPLLPFVQVLMTVEYNRSPLALLLTVGGAKPFSFLEKFKLHHRCYCARLLWHQKRQVNIYLSGAPLLPVPKSWCILPLLAVVSCFCEPVSPFLISGRHSGWRSTVPAQQEDSRSRSYFLSLSPWRRHALRCLC